MNGRNVVARLGAAVLRALALALTMAAPARALDEVRLADGRSYLVAVPKGAAHPPLILALHGGGGNPAQFARNSGLEQAALARGYAVAFPAGSGRTRLLTWNAGHCCAYAQRARVDDIAFLDAVVADAARRFGIGQVFVTGMSNGAMMASAYAASRPQVVRAAAVVAGTLDARRFPPQGRVGFLHMHGTDDPRVPYAGGIGKAAAQEVDYRPAAADVADFAARWSVRAPVRRQDGPLVRDQYLRDGRVVAELVTVPGGAHDWFGGRRAGAGVVSATRVVLDFFDLWR